MQNIYQEPKQFLKIRDCVTFSVNDKLWHLTTTENIEFTLKETTRRPSKTVTLKTHLLLDIYNNMYHKKYHMRENVVVLNTEILRKKYGPDYNHYIEYLKCQGVLIKTKEYIVGIQGRSYRLNKIDTKTPHKKYTYFGASFVKKINKRQAEIRTEINNYIPLDIQEMLIEDLNYISLEIDKAKEILLTLKSNNKIETGKYYYNLLHIEKIMDVNQRYATFDRYGRMHTDFTTIKKDIRKTCLKIDGLETVELDICNSQPRFLIEILKENMDLLDQKEYNKYVKYCKEGTLYDKIVEISRIDLMRYRLNRSEAKLLVYKVFFGRNGKTCKFSRIFGKMFPTILQFIKKYKMDHGNHAKLSHTLQLRESKLVFSKIVREIKNKYPEIRLFTVHDSLIIPKIYKQEVEAIFDRLISENFNF